MNASHPHDGRSLLELIDGYARCVRHEATAISGALRLQVADSGRALRSEIYRRLELVKQCQGPEAETIKSVLLTGAPPNARTEEPPS